MKKFISLFLTGSVFLGAYAEQAIIDYTYAQDQLFQFGKGKKEAIDVAMCINNPSLTGKKITGFRAYIATNEGIGSTSLWLSKELNLKNNVNVPDLYSVDVTPKAQTVGEYELQVLETKLETPYVLTGEPLYLGYSMTVTANTTEAQKKPIILSKGVNPDGLFLHMKQSVLKWMEYSENAQGVAFIVAELEGEYSDYSLGFKGYEPIYAEIDEKFNASFLVSNTGANDIASVNYTYTVDDNPQKFIGSVNLPTPIEPSVSLNSSLSLNFNGISEIGPHTLNVEITEVNDYPNESLNSSISAIVNVMPFIPVHRPLVEEFTGLWCGWCTRGYLAMEMIAEEFGENVVGIAYHNSDPMAVTNDYPVTVPGFPNSSLNRKGTLDPYYGTDLNVEFGIGQDILNSMDELAIADIHVEGSLNGSEINVTSTVTFIQSIDNANYQIGYVLAGNGLSNENWKQRNYYNTETGLAGSPLEILTQWPDPVEGLIFNDVVIDVSGMRGVEGSLPSSIVIGKEYAHDFSFNIVDNRLASDSQNLMVATFIVDKNSGYIVNANKLALGNLSGIKEVVNEDDNQVIATEYYDISGRKVRESQKGILIQRSFLSSGSVKTLKVINR